MDWEATNDDADPNHFEWTYYNSVYSNAKFQQVWNTLRYLTQKGIESGLVLGFMGQPPAWMGGNSTVSYLWRLADSSRDDRRLLLPVFHLRPGQRQLQRAGGLGSAARDVRERH